MPHIQIASRKATWRDIGRKVGEPVPVVMHVKHFHNDKPHYGKKESAKLAARMEEEIDHVACVGCGEFGEPNYDGGLRYCGHQFCCP